LRVLAAAGVLTKWECLALDPTNALMKTMVKSGLVALAVGVAMAGSLPAIADKSADSWSVRGLTRPGGWFEKYNT